MFGNLNGFLDIRIEPLGLLLPLAISFFTFQQIAYITDVYRHEAPSYRFIEYMMFVSFFPHLIAGPIVHHAEILSQFASDRNRKLRNRNIARGLFIFFIGLFKKTIIADSLAVWANDGFAASQSLSFGTAWLTSLSYSLQLYYDFSGYTDMAIGAALLFNIRMPQNFNSPYKALSIREFWQRWHMTLSRFLSRYVYIPLGGSRSGAYRTAFNLVLLFTLSGLWHGAGWTFVVWGMMHGVAMVVQRTWTDWRIRRQRQPLPRWIAWLITFQFVNVGWVFFRSDSLEDAISIVRTMYLLHSPPLATDIPSIGFMTLLAVSLLLLLAGKARNSNELLRRFRPNARTAVLLGFAAAYLLLSLNQMSEFLYFNF
jgi:D-alanyl-lipoteichoic acid acyltransferase DltB (MBOAT superfamily)